jgi:hypothetical protein
MKIKMRKQQIVNKVILLLLNLFLGRKESQGLKVISSGTISSGVK